MIIIFSLLVNISPNNFCYLEKCQKLGQYCGFDRRRDVFDNYGKCCDGLRCDLIDRRPNAGICKEGISYYFATFSRNIVQEYI